MSKGSIYLFPVLLSNSTLDSVIPQDVIRSMHTINLFAAEQVRTARRFLLKSGLQKTVDQLEFAELNKRTGEQEVMELLMRVIQGENLGLLSESGMPCIADPGTFLVNQAHELDIRVKPLTGPSSILLGLAASGFSGQKFAFHGYLPIDQRQREQAIRNLEKNVYNLDQTQIFIETPYRNVQLFKSMLKVCGGNTKIALGIELTGSEEQMMVYRVQQWKTMNMPPIHKKNVIFLVYK